MAKSLFKSTSIFAGMTFLSRILGFARDMIVASLLGATAGSDAFFVAFKLPNFMRRLFGEGAFSQAFVPVLSEYREHETHEEVRRFISRVMGTLGLTLFIFTILAVLLAPQVIHLFAPGFHAGEPRFEMASHMLRITFPYVLFICLTAMAGATLNSYDRFAAPAFTPVFLNLSLIVAALWAAPRFDVPVYALAYGVFAAGVIQLLFQFPFLSRLQLLPKPAVHWKDPGVKRVIRLMLPALFGAGISQLNLMLDTIFASFLTVGSVSWLYYSDRLTSFPLGVIGVAVATVVLPHLSRQHVSGTKASYSKGMDWGIQTVLLLGMPAAVGLLLLAVPLLSTLLQYGEFSHQDMIMTSRSLMALAIGVPFFMLAKVLASGFYSRQDIKTPVKVGLVAMFVNIFFNALLIQPLAHAGLALATTIASAVQVIILASVLKRQGHYIPGQGWSMFWLRLFLSNSALALSLFFTRGASSLWEHWLWYQRAFHLLGLVFLAVAVYFVSLRLLGLPFRWYVNLQESN